ncbi:BAR domain-containing protein [Leucoagaricus gongylophorus]
MQGWKSLQSSINAINLAQASSKFTKGFSQSVQATKERLGQVAPEDITELPQEYKDLEARVDALKYALSTLQKITRIYEHESYDYPTQIQETISGITSHVGYNLTSFAAQNLKNTNLPSPSPPTAPPPAQHKTLPHALTRAASAAHASIANAPDGSADKLGKGLGLFAQGWDKVALARVEQDRAIQDRFLQPWQITLNASVSVAMKARSAVKVSRLDLDAAKQALKNAGPTRQEHARLEVENAEDDLVQKTEVAIQLMKAVLDNPEPLKNINELVKAQLVYFSDAAEALSAVQGEIEELGVAAEGEYRKSRDH